MMPRRLLGPFGRCLLFVLVAGLVVGGLGWVTYASLGVESEQRTTAAAADRSANERIALWRLDGKLLPTLGAENFRAFEHFTAIYSPQDVTNTIYQNSFPGQLAGNSVVQTQQFLSPLAVEELESWMLLHAQLDPDSGWSSPQVLVPETVDQLQREPNSLYLLGVTDDRRKLLSDLNRVLPARETARRLADLEGEGRSESPLPVELAKSPTVPLDRAIGRATAGTGNSVQSYAEVLFALVQKGAKSGQPSPKEPSRMQSQAVESLPPKIMSPAAGLTQITPDTGPQKPSDSNAGRMVQGGNFNNTQLAQNSLGAQGNVSDPGDAQKRANAYNKTGPPGRGGQQPGQSQNPGNPDSAMPPGMAQSAVVPPPGPAGPGGPAPSTPAPSPATGGPGGNAGPPAPAGFAGGGPTGQPLPGGFGGGAPGAGGSQAGAGGFGGMQGGKGAFGGGGGGVASRSGGAGRPGAAPETRKDEKPAGEEKRSDSKQDGTAKKLEEKAEDKSIADSLQKDQKSGFADNDRKEPSPPPPAPAVVPATMPATTVTQLPSVKGQERFAMRDDPNKAGGADSYKSSKEQVVRQKAEQGFGKDETLRLRAADNELAKKDLPSNRRPPPAGVHLGTMRPVWLTDTEGNPRLLFARAATMANNRTVYQAIFIDWEALREVLLAEVTDLFPAAGLKPILAGAPVAPERTMAALPAELDLGPVPELPPAGWTPLRIGLALGWVAALVALAAVWFGGWSLVDLSERRIRFVSAVTHELRTPLTSLRLYLDMLTAGMVKEEQKKQEYLATLSTESDRLNRLIENVLDFSRLERRNSKVVREPVPVADLLARVKETWTERVAADGKELQVVAVVPPGQSVTVDPRMVEQILGNLVDNARKYTRDAADPRIWVWAKPAGRRWVAFEVEDRGPGIPVAERRSIFRPFRRGSEADTTAGGAGLGLALAKQWAELCGGRLGYRSAEGGTGACFRLDLPVG